MGKTYTSEEILNMNEHQLQTIRDSNVIDEANNNLSSAAHAKLFFPKAVAVKKQAVGPAIEFNDPQIEKNAEGALNADDSNLLQSALKENTTDEDYEVLQQMASSGDQQSRALLDQKNAQVVQAAATFINNTPSYVKCVHNKNVITQYMIKYGLNPTVQNFELVFNILVQRGALYTQDWVQKKTKQAQFGGMTDEEVKHLSADEYAQRLKMSRSDRF